MPSKKTVADTSVLISGKVSELVSKGELKGELIILEAVLSELENQANQGRVIGFEGLEEIKKLKGLEEKKKITLRFYGDRPTPEEIKAARYGAIDAKIREVAQKENAMLLTGDYVQFLVAEARGMDCKHLDTRLKGIPKIHEFFDAETMSVHLKENVAPMAKKGSPGKVRLVRLSETPSTTAELEHLIRNIVDYGRESKGIEMDMKGATVVQLGDFRIAIAKPPFSKSLEVTAVRPIAKVDLDSYELSGRLKKRLEDRAEGVFICGPPGAGKSSFAAALGNFYSAKGTIVKTMESPRDLQVNPEVTQYAPLEGSMAKTADVLLLVRPDYTIYDEVRKSADFNIFADMRLSGVGMIGVTHAASPMDAIQRLISRIDLGQIPHIVDTVIFIKDAEIKKIYQTRLSVKVPVGMMEDDLARPVVEVIDFETQESEYEIYTFGDEKVIMSVLDAPKDTEVEVRATQSEFVLHLSPDARGKKVTIYAGSRVLFKTRLGKETDVRFKTKTKLGKMIQRAERYGDKIHALIDE